MSDLSSSHQLAQTVDAIHRGSNGEEPIRLMVAEEVPVAFRYNGFPHAVMMATPDDLEDFAYGFTLTEGLIDGADGIRRLDLQPRDGGIGAHITLNGGSLHRFLSGRRVRQSRGNTSCGICGVQDLADLHTPFRAVQKGHAPSKAAIQTALNALRALQPLSRGTRGAHASAWVEPSGSIAAVREDVGRHNSLDKLIGAGLRGGFDATCGFCLITSRCSYEMAHKAVVAGFGTLVSVSAPTALAIRTASEAGLTLYSISGGEDQFLYTPPISLKECISVVKS
jgi:FdhD protein